MASDHTQFFLMRGIRADILDLYHTPKANKAVMLQNMQSLRNLIDTLIQNLERG